MSGTDTALFKGRFDSRRTACAAAGATMKKAATAASGMSAQRFRRPGCLTFLFAKNGEKLSGSDSRALTARRKLCRSQCGLAFHSAPLPGTRLSPRPAENRRKFAGANDGDAGRNYSCVPISLLWFQSMVGSDAGSVATSGVVLSSFRCARFSSFILRFSMRFISFCRF